MVGGVIIVLRLSDSQLLFWELQGWYKNLPLYVLVVWCADSCYLRATLSNVNIRNTNNEFKIK